MFTKENTARATHSTPSFNGSKLPVNLYDCSKFPVEFLDAYSGTWKMSGFNAKDIIGISGVKVLSRPQSDIDALFNDAPDFANAIGRAKGETYWLGQHGYNITTAKDKNDLAWYSFGAYFAKNAFTIIATRPPVENGVKGNVSPIADSAPSLYEKPVISAPVFTKEMADSGGMPPVGSMALFVDESSQTEVECKILMYHLMSVFIYVDGWDGGSVISSTTAFKPIDTRTGREKSIDALSGVDNCYMPKDDATGLFDDIQAGKIPDIEYTGK